MASCSLGAPHIKVPKLSFGKARVDNLKPNSVRIWIRQRPLQHTTLVRHSEKAFSICCAPTLETQTTTNLVDDSEETKSSGLTSELIPNSSGVESLVRDICDTTSIAEFELKLGGFRLYVARNLSGKSEPPPPPLIQSPPVSVSTNKIVEAADSNGSVSTPTLAITKPLSSSGRIQSLLDRAADEGLVILKSPMVGTFRRSRTIKEDERAPPACEENQMVKEGKALCYIERLGGEIPIESDVSGEVIKFLRQDGDPIAYGDALIAILPSFPGIKKLLP
ncbi:Biotin/lipoyl attachment [Corchorus olitorius]|uniref:Biotin/lipoyl attachment n=1 Tax=Corchorus olitorius TaxID=93759 RepID=A0A1R3JZ43_9ROSI|nr:Biotin/lipoyl attachment [Corchorus olitorius]